MGVFLPPIKRAVDDVRLQVMQYRQNREKRSFMRVKMLRKDENSAFFK
jgi:hypothetical protein